LRHPEEVTGIAFNTKGNALASIGEDGLVRLWDLRNRELLGPVNPVGREFPLGVNYGASGLVVASLDEEVGELRVRRYDADGGTPPRSLGSWPGQTPEVRFSADGSVLAIRASPVEDDGTVVWGAPSIVKLRDTALGAPFGAAMESLSGMALSPDGRTVAVAADENSVVIVSVLANHILAECVTGHEAHVSPRVFSPDGRRLAVVGEDPAEPGAWTVVQCDTATGRPVGASLRLRQVMDLAFSPDGRIIATASDTPPFVTLWDAATGKPIGELFLSERNNKENTMLTLAFSPDGKSLAVANNREVLLADLDFEAKKARMCRIINRNLTRDEWNKYLGDRPYEITCPSVPGAAVR
jgi:WD40 repeat protein